MPFGYATNAMRRRRVAACFIDAALSHSSSLLSVHSTMIIVNRLGRRNPLENIGEKLRGKHKPQDTSISRSPEAGRQEASKNN